MRRTRFLAGLAAGSLLATTTVAALAAPAGAGDDPPAPSQVTVVHGIPDVTVDVYAGGDLLLEDFEFGDFEGPVPVPAGSLDVQVFAADADPGTATPVIDDTLAIPAGETISLVANLDEGGAPELSPFIEDNDPVPFDNGRVSVRHTADAPAVDVLAEGGVLLPALPNGDEASAVVPQRAYGVQVQVSPSGPVALDLGNVPVVAGRQLNVYAVGSAGGGTLQVLVQDVEVTHLSDVYVAHGIPGVAVDVYVNGDLTLPGFMPKDVEGPLALPEGSYDITVYAAGANPASDPAVITQTVAVPAGQSVTAIANIEGGTPKLSAFVNDAGPTLPGQAKAVVRHTADAPTVDIQLDGADALSGLAPGAEASAPLPAGTYDVDVEVSPDGPVALPLGEVAFAAGTTTTVYAIGSAGGATLDVIVVVTEPGQQFGDVDGFQQFFDEIQFLLDNGIAGGFDDGTFRPLDTISRQALSAFLYRLANEGASAPACTEAPFPDVAVDSPFCGEIAWMDETGLSTGFGDGTFRPLEPVSRGSLSAFLYRADGAVDGPSPTCEVAAFTDVPADHPFCGEITWMVDNDYATGFSDDSFRPGNPLTRQAQAAFLARYLMAQEK